MTELDAAERNYRNAIEESRKGKRELAAELSAHGGLLLVQHLRASQPATETGEAREAAGRVRVSRALDRFYASGESQPVEAVSDERLDAGRRQFERLTGALAGTVGFPVQFSFLGHQAGELLAFLRAQAEASRSAAAKDARIARTLRQLKAAKQTLDELLRRGVSGSDFVTNALSVVDYAIEALTEEPTP